LVITITATAPTTQGTCLANTATVTANELDTVTDNDSSSFTTCTSTPSGGTLKVCKVAGFGVTVGTPFNFAYKTGSGSGTVAVPAGPAPGGYCVVVGTFKPGSYTVTEEPSTGNTVTAITAVPSGGSADLKKGSFTGKLEAQTVTELTYTDQNVPPGAETGYLEVCKQVQAQPGVSLPSYFVFTVDEPDGLVQTLDVPPNACSPATEVVSGSETVTETPVSGYSISACSSIPAANLVSCNPNGNTATVTVDPGGVPAETILTVTNTLGTANGCGGSSTGTIGTATTSTPTTSTISYGNSDTDSVVVRGGGTNPNLLETGTVCFYLCGPTQSPQACTSQADPVGSPVAVTSAAPGELVTATSPAVTPPDSPVATWWCFGAYYSGDSNFSPSSDTSTDGCFEAT
jgi:hypothetical protein